MRRVLLIVKSKSFYFRIIRVMVQLLLRLSENQGEWGLVELQGQLETRDGAPFDGMHMGDLHFDAQVRHQCHGLLL